MCGLTKRDMIKNEDIRAKEEVAYVADKMQEPRLRWFGHIKRRCMDGPMRRCERLTMEGLRRDRGRPKKYWEEVIRQNLVSRKTWQAFDLPRTYPLIGGCGGRGFR